MAPRSYSNNNMNTPPPTGLPPASGLSSTTNTTTVTSPHHNNKMFERRHRMMMRRKKTSKVDNNNDEHHNTSSSSRGGARSSSSTTSSAAAVGGTTTTSSSRRLRNKHQASSSTRVTVGSEDRHHGGGGAAAMGVDPYDSDPGESYREYCMKNRLLGTRKCLSVPKFLRSATARGSSAALASRDEEEESELTAPPSPIASDNAGGDIPASLQPAKNLVRYSLRSSITDGSEPQPSGPSIMDRRELRPNGISLNVSHWSDEGARAYMEDRYCIENLDAVTVEVSPVAVKSSSGGHWNQQDVEVTYGGGGGGHHTRTTRRINMPLTFLAVYDGHGGDKASQFCADWMTSYVRNDKSYPYDLGYSMKNSFNRIDDDFVGTGQPDGSTACAVTIVGGRRIVCANAGDSRAIVVRRDGSVVRLSRDHKPGMPDETRRISELGGRVIYWGRWRVEGMLAVSRAIGDAALKPYITAEPEICEYDVGKDDLFLIMSSDGVWDVMGNEEAAHVVIASSCSLENGKLKIDTDRFKWAARNLCEHARSCGSTDNFSVICVDLKSCRNRSAESGSYQP